MNRISTIFLALAAGVLVFALYIDRNPNSGSAKQLFKRSTESRGTVPAGTQSSSIPGLRNSLDEVARNIGFESETVEVNFVNREFRTLGGQPIHLKQHKDRWIVLNFS